MRAKIAAVVFISIATLMLGAALGSVYIPPGNALNIIAHKMLGLELSPEISGTSVAILWNTRFPRVLLAYIVGGALSVSGAVMQSALRNPLASSYTLGVSSGASLGAGIVILFGVTLPVLNMFTQAAMGFIFGLMTIFVSVAFASRLNRQMDNNTIILTGMVFSLFFSAVSTLMLALQREHMQRLIFWLMGSFSSGGWQAATILAPIAAVLTLFVLRYNSELDIMTFGEEQAMAIGVSLRSMKWRLLMGAAALTGSAVAFVGVIGFVDLVAPHIVRRLFGSSHRYVIPMSFLFGGSFMVVCDLIARTIISPHELPVGAVTAIIGAPFFAYVYFRGR